MSHANPTGGSRLRDGVGYFNEWRAEFLITSVNLSKADLAGMDLSRANLSEVNLEFTDLSDARLTAAVMSSADLSGANLTDADLSEANMVTANLSDATLRWSNLSGADLFRADLRRADMSGATLTGARLVGANLDGADLTSANLIGADPSGANLVGAKWQPDSPPRWPVGLDPPSNAWADSPDPVRAQDLNPTRVASVLPEGLQNLTINLEPFLTVVDRLLGCRAPVGRDHFGGFAPPGMDHPCAS